MSSNELTLEELIPVFTAKLVARGVAAFQREDFKKAQQIVRAAEDFKRLCEPLLCVDSGLPTQPELRREESSPTQDERTRSQRFDTGTEPRNAYPRYLRRGDDIVKQALRGDGSTIYEQRISLSGLKTIVNTIAEARREKPSFHVPEILRKTNFPQYQVYLVLGLMTSCALVDQPKRGLYALKDPTQPPREVVDALVAYLSSEG